APGISASSPCVAKLLASRASTVFTTTDGRLDMERTSRVSGVVWKLAWLVVGLIVTHVVAAHAGDATPAAPETIQQAAQKVAPSDVAILPPGPDAIPTR